MRYLSYQVFLVRLAHVHEVVTRPFSMYEGAWGRGLTMLETRHLLVGANIDLLTHQIKRAKLHVQCTHCIVIKKVTKEQ